MKEIKDKGDKNIKNAIKSKIIEIQSKLNNLEMNAKNIAKELEDDNY